MAYQYTKQLSRTLFISYQLLSTLFVRFPLWVFLGIPRQVASTQLRPYTFLLNRSNTGLSGPGNLGI